MKKQIKNHLLIATYYLLLARPALASSGEPPTLCALETIFKGLLNVALGFGGLALFIMFIMSGYRWLTAGTNEKAIQQARAGFLYAIVGLALMIGAWFILLFIENFTGIEVTVFKIPGC